MPATVSTRGVLKASTNRVRTSTALQGSAMWENVIGVVNEERGTNAGVEALIHAPQRGGGNHNDKKEARRAAAAEAVLATGGFDNAITSYNELLSLAKSQGAMGEGATRGACKICGQLGHLTKQCRNQFSKFYEGGDARPSTAAGAAAIPSADGSRPAFSDDSLGSLGRDSDKLSSDSSSGDSDSEEERRRRRRKKKVKKCKREREHKEKKRRHKERDHGGRSSSGKDKKHKKSRRHRRRSRSRSLSPKRGRRH